MKSRVLKWANSPASFPKLSQRNLITLWRVVAAQRLCLQ